MKRERGAMNLASLVLVALGMVFIGIGAFFIPIMIEGFEAGRTSCSGEDITETDSLVSDNGVNYIGSITLNRPLCKNYITSVTSVSSNLSGDAPVADNYTTLTQVLNLTGLTDNGTRTITTVYDYAAIGFFTGLNSVLTIGPTILVLGFIVGGAVVGFMGIKGLGS